MCVVPRDHESCNEFFQFGYGPNEILLDLGSDRTKARGCHKSLRRVHSQVFLRSKGRRGGLRKYICQTHLCMETALALKLASEI